MATKTARKPTAAKSTKSKTKATPKSAKTSKSKVSVGKKMNVKSASKTRTTSKAKKAIAPKKAASKVAAPSKASKKMEKPANDAKFAQEQDEMHGLTAQPKMKLSRRKPDNFRDQQRINSTPDSVNPATRR